MSLIKYEHVQIWPWTLCLHLGKGPGAVICGEQLLREDMSASQHVFFWQAIFIVIGVNIHWGTTWFMIDVQYILGLCFLFEKGFFSINTFGQWHWDTLPLCLQSFPYVPEVERSFAVINLLELDLLCVLYSVSQQTLFPMGLFYVFCLKKDIVNGACVFF